MTGKKVLIGAIVLIAVFLAGFLPPYLGRQGLDEQLKQRTLELEDARLVNLIGQAYMQAAGKNYGLASQTSTQFFNRLREAADANPGRAEAYREILALRDRITAALAQADPAALSALQEAYAKTRALAAP